MENNFPNASEFSPKILKLNILLELCKKNEGKPEEFISEVLNTFFSEYAADSQKQLTGNCRAALVAYGILHQGKIELTEFGEELYNERLDSSKLHDMLARHILLNLNGLVLIDAIKDMNIANEKVTNENIITKLNTLGFNMSKSSKKINTMKTWLAKAGVFEGTSWRINHTKLNALTGMKKEDLECYRDLSKEQICFIKALNNTGIKDRQESSAIRKLASATFNVTFPEKNFKDIILRPLEEKGLLKTTKATNGRGAKSTFVTPTEKMLSEVTIPYLKQIENLTSEKMAKIFQLPTKDILKNIQSEDKYIKGIALEALAFKLMKSIGMEYVKTRLRSVDTGGAEVDLLFESTTLVFSRWQIQCKNTKTVDLDAVAKEVGLSHMLKSNAIVMVGTGTIGDAARQYANTIMRNSNLCIILIDGNDLKNISENPTAIIDVFNRESEKAKQIKVLELN